MSGSRSGFKTAFWDSCVFLGWLNNESDKATDSLQQFINDVESGSLLMYYSAISHAEILDKILPSTTGGDVATAGTRFRAWAKKYSYAVECVNVDPRIAELARELRGKSNAIPKGNTTMLLKWPDALICASAITYEAEVLHTYDPDILDLVPSGILGRLVAERPSYPPPPPAEPPKEPSPAPIQPPSPQRILRFPDEPDLLQT